MPTWYETWLFILKAMSRRQKSGTDSNNSGGERLAVASLPIALVNTAAGSEY